MPKRRKSTRKQVVTDKLENCQAQEQLVAEDVLIQENVTEVVENTEKAMEIEANQPVFNQENEGHNQVNSEAVMDIETPNLDGDAYSHEKKSCRGPTKAKRLPSDIMSRIEVEFNTGGEPIGDGSIKLSSYLGPLVREHVPVTLTDWRLLSDDLKFVLWNSIKARFKLDEEWQKVPIFQQMGCIWRASKSRLVSQIIKATTIEERLKLKPDNIKSTKEWKDFIKIKTSSNFKAQSEKYKSMRRIQLPHTCGRKGMARLTEDLKKDCAYPSSISRADVWVKSRTRKNGEPVNMDVADTIEKVKKIQSESQSSSATIVREDAISLVLGRDRPGRLRGMGRGATYTRYMLSQVKDQQAIQFQNRISKLEEELRMLKENQGIIYRKEESTSQSNCGKKNDKCDLLDCFGTDEIVAKGSVVSTDPKELVHKIPIGPNAMKVLIESPRNLDAFLWRPASNMIHIGEAVDMLVAWPADRVILHTLDQTDIEDNVSKSNSTDNKCKLFDWTGSDEVVAEGHLICSDPMQLVNDIPLGPSAVLVSIDSSTKSNAYLWRPAAGMIYVEEAVGNKVAWPEAKVVMEKVNAPSFPVTPANTSTSPMTGHSTTKNKCKLIDVSGKGEVVAEGRVASTNPDDLVHFVRLGKDAVKVWVDVVRIPEAVLWRPSSEFECIEDAMGSTIAWPAANVVEC